MGRGMETKIEAPEQESGVVMSEIAPALNREIEELGIGDFSKPSNWKKRLGALMVAGTVLAGSMAGSVKEAKAGPHLSQVFEQAVNTAAQRTAEGLGKGIGNTVERLFGGGKTAEEQRDEQRLKDDIQRQGINLKMEEIRRGWQKQDNRDNTQTQLDAEFIRQYREELKAAKTPADEDFVKKKYGMRGR